MEGEPSRDLCVLCQTPLSGRAEARGRFCCAGCERVHDVLGRLDASAHASYLEAARRLGIIPEDGGGRARPEAAAVETDEEAAREERFSLSGLACPSCAWVVEQVLESNEGVLEANVDYFSGTARVRYDLRRCSAADLGGSLDLLGYRIAPLADDSRGELSRRATIEFVVAAVITMNVMTLASLRYFEGLRWLDEVPELLVWVEALLVLPVLYLGWIPTVRRVVVAARSGRVTMDLLIGIAVGAAALLSGAALLTGRSEIYFETCAGLVTISLMSRMIEARLRQKAFEELAPLLRMKVVHVRKLGPGGEESFVGIEEVHPGERVAFHPGETVPFDGEAVGPRAFVSEAVLTGEPRPLAKVSGDLVVAGSRVMEGTLELVVTRRYEETRLSRIAVSVGQTLSRAENRLRAADRITAWFVPSVLAVALGVWIVRLFTFGLDHALTADGWFPSVAVLAVACPCAFSLAGVAAVTAATGNLLSRGFLVKEPAQLVDLARVSYVIFDKTGTVTEGEMVVDELVWKGAPREEDLPLVLAAERYSNHPVAQAIRAFLDGRTLPETGAPASPVKDLPGEGRLIPVEGGEFAVGSAALFSELFEPAGITPRHSVVWFGRGGAAAGCFLITDKVRTDAAGVVEELKQAGLGVELLSGDRPEVTERVARELGIEQARGDVSIAAKVEAVRGRLEEKGAVAFVGDGTNDALAMGEATVSISLARATDEALGASGLVSLGGSLSGLSSVFTLGRKLNRVIRGNYVWAFAFNTLFIPVAAAGKLAPLAAMLLMLVSSAAVLLNSLRLRS